MVSVRSCFILAFVMLLNGCSYINMYSGMSDRECIKNFNQDSFAYLTKLEKGITFNTNSADTVIKVKGLSTPESHGRWSDGNYVELLFQNCLPLRFKIYFEVAAFVSVMNMPIGVSIGDAHNTFTLTDGHTKVIVMNFILRERTDRIAISIPNPKSPKELGLSGDPRRVGITLKSIRIAGY